MIPGGVSAPLIPESGFDVGMDFDSLAAAGSMLGSAGVIVIDDSACVVKVATRIIEFFDHETCGKCTPCREGLDWVVKVMRRIEAGEGALGDLDQLEALCNGIFGKHLLRARRRRGDGPSCRTRVLRRRVCRPYRRGEVPVPMTPRRRAESWLPSRSMDTRCKPKPGRLS